MRRMVFIGDSITDAHRRSDPLQLGSGYVNLIAEGFAQRDPSVEVINRGVSGECVRDLRDRWQRDVLDLEPDVLTVYIGVNDTVRTWFQGFPTPPAEFEADLDDVLSRSVARGTSTIIVIEPFFLTDVPFAGAWRAGEDFARADLDSKRPIVEALARAHGATFIPLQAAMSAAALERGAALIAQDGVHPTGLGERRIARLWFEAFDSVE